MNNKNYYILVFFFAVIFSLVNLPEIKGQGYGDRNRAGNGRFRITGKIILPNGKPAVGIKISMSGADFTNGSAQTDSEGKFLFDSIPAGNYTLSVDRSDEYSSASENLTIAMDTTPGQTFNVYISLVFSSRTKENNNPLFSKVPKASLEKYKQSLEKIEKNDSKAALSLLEEAIKLYPDFAAAYNQAGVILLKNNELDKALGAFSNAIQIQPDYFDAKMNYGFTLLSLKDFQDSEKVMQDVIKQKDDVPNAHLYLGIALSGLNKTDEAENAFRKSISLKGGENVAQAHKYLGRIYIKKNMKAEAISELQKYIELAPKASDVDKIKATIEDLKKPSN